MHPTNRPNCHPNRSQKQATPYPWSLELRSHPLPHDHLGVGPKAVDVPDQNQVAAAEEVDHRPNTIEVVGGVLVGPALEDDVEDADPAGPQRALDLAHEAIRVEGVVEDVGEFEVEGAIAEGLAVEVALEDQRRVGDEVDADGVEDADAVQGLDFLADAGADAEGLGAVGEEVGALEAGEEEGEDGDLALPVAGGPDAPELGVEGFVELAVDVGVVGGVSGADAEAGGGGVVVVVVVVAEEEEEGEEDEGGEEDGGDEEGLGGDVLHHHHHHHHDHGIKVGRNVRSVWRA
ncbi:hypothetical protein Syun_024356 [Stephania yunnanensis]|uniref:Uncharacterized protein n=1 Tax=Stephania yunnanensis TaxID=152371 RepID=A0AAP0I492_9MAGN